MFGTGNQASVAEHVDRFGALAQTIKAIFLGCWVTHGEKLIERNEDGALTFVCQRCGDVSIPDLRLEEEKGKAHRQVEAAGVPKCKARRFGSARSATAVVTTFAGASKSAIARRK